MIDIDVTAYIGDFNWTKAEVDEMREFISKAYVNSAYSELVELAMKRLNTSRQQYIDSIEIKQVDRFTNELVLHGSLPNMIESGANSFDMKYGFLSSPKAKLGKNGSYYLTIPFAFRTTSANANSGNAGQLLPRTIYDLIRNKPAKKVDRGDFIISSLEENQVSKKYAPKQRTTIIENPAMKRYGGSTQQIAKYTPKSSIYAGLQRTFNKETGKSTYNTFRRVSSNSDAASWIHRGIKAYNLMDEAMRSANIENAIDKGLDEYFLLHS